MAQESESIQEAMQSLARRMDVALTNERRTRTTLLRWHGWKALIAGILILFWGAPGQWELLIGPWVQPVLGLLGFIAGLLLLRGINGQHGIDHLVLALFLIGLWDLVMTVSIAASIVLNPSDLTPHLPWPLGEVHDPFTPRPYPILVYGALAGMVWTVHLRSVWRERRYGL